MLVLITGGAASGKSAFAEDFIQKLEMEKKYYVATMRPYDAEAVAKVKRHQQMRANKGFITIEAPCNLAQITRRWDSQGVVLLECLSNLLANEMYDEKGNECNPVESIANVIEEIESSCHTLVIISNEIFSEGMKYEPSTQRYIQYLGRLHQKLGARADLVVEVVFGLVVVRKGELR